MSDSVETSDRARAGKYLTFVLGSENYGLEILKVREIIGLPEITRVPHTPHFVRGVTNLRGKVIPVIDLRRKFDLDEVSKTDFTCVVVVDVGDVVGSIELGIVVDQVSEVLDIREDDITDAPDFGLQIDTDFILGMGKAGERVTILLDIARVLSREEVRAARSVGSDPAPSK
jgi:purine-binding chemotaxis protein CheW